MDSVEILRQGASDNQARRPPCRCASALQQWGGMIAFAMFWLIDNKH